MMRQTVPCDNPVADGVYTGTTSRGPRTSESGAVQRKPVRPNRAHIPWPGRNGRHRDRHAQSGKVWLVFNGAVRTTVTVTDPQATQLIDALTAASRGQR